MNRESREPRENKSSERTEADSKHFLQWVNGDVFIIRSACAIIAYCAVPTAELICISCAVPIKNRPCHKPFLFRIEQTGSTTVTIIT